MNDEKFVLPPSAFILPTTATLAPGISNNPDSSGPTVCVEREA